MRMQVIRRTILGALVLLSIATAGGAATPREQLHALTVQLQQSPGEDALREQIIRLALTLKPAPALPTEAERRMARGSAAFSGATSVADFQVAANEFEQAIQAAPWYGNAYFNLGLAQDKAENYDGALRSLRFAALASPGSKDAETLSYAVEFRKEKANSPAARAAQQQRDDEALVRSLDGVRFDCPNMDQSAANVWEVDEHWVTIKGGRLAAWLKVIREDADLVRARPQDYALGHISHVFDEPITGTIARKAGPDWYSTYQITGDRVVITFRPEMNEPAVTCIRR